MGIPKCFHALGCFEVTFILRDFKTVTGKIVSLLDDDRKKYWDCEKQDDHKKDDHKKDDHKKDDHKKDDCDKCDKCDDDKKKTETICCKPKVNVKVDVDDKCDFILVELTRDAESVSLQEIECDGNDLEIEVLNVEFRKGSCIALNVCDIIYAGINPEFEETEFTLDVESCEEENGLTATSNKTITTPTP